MKRLNHFVRTTLLGGAVVVLPVTIFILLAKLIFDTIRALIDPVSSILPFRSISSDILLDLIAFGLIIAFFFLMGLFVQTRLGQGLITLIESELLHRLPFYGAIKETVLQFTGAKRMPFSQVAVVRPYGPEGSKMFGFVADEHKNGMYTIFVPTAPNPTNGFVFYMEAKDVELVDVKPEEAIRMIIGIGTGASKLF